MSAFFSHYMLDSAYDEMFDAEWRARPHYRALIEELLVNSPEVLRQRQLEADRAFITQGITFTVYGDDQGTERIFPFDLLPRILTGREWDTLERGLAQRLTAVNLFLKDIYHEGRILSEGVVPPDLVYSCRHYRREMRGVRVHKDIYVSIAGTDLIRLEDGQFVVLEDNLRVPSGVSYMLANREVTKRVFPGLFTRYNVKPIAHYGQSLLATLRTLTPANRAEPTIVVLTPGVGNSAYFEHAFLAREMGVPLVEGRDLLVEGSRVFMRRTHGRRQVDVIYRRIDDDFLDPLTFRRDSLLGVPGLINAYRHGTVALANAPGAGVADDKSVYAFMPRLIKYYLDEDPLLPQVPTYLGFRPDDFTYITEHAHELVVKTTGDAGGYGMLMGPFAAKAEVECYVARMRANPGNYIAQPLVELSSHPTHVDGRFEPRRIDLRPFILYGDRVRVLPGGLTRVALRPGSYVVNSSQGGGSKDTWVLAPRDA